MSHMCERLQDSRKYVQIGQNWGHFVGLTCVILDFSLFLSICVYYLCIIHCVGFGFICRIVCVGYLCSLLLHYV